MLLKNEKSFSSTEELLEDEKQFLVTVRNTGSQGDWIFQDEVWSFKGKPVLDNSGEELKCDEKIFDDYLFQPKKRKKKFFFSWLKMLAFFSNPNSFSDFNN